MSRKTIQRWAAALLCLFILAGAAGAEEELRGYSKEDGYVYVTLGQYPQVIDGGIPDDGRQAWIWRREMYQEHKVKGEMREEGIDPEAVEPSPILWRILSADDEKIFLLSEFILFPSPMHESDKEYRSIGKDFSQTDLSRKLNGEFLEKAFTAEEQEMIIPHEEFGKVFILSAAELKNKEYGFLKDRNRRAWATEYAIRACGAFVYQTAKGNHSPYWTRDQAKNLSAARCTKQDGDIGYYNCKNPEEGARPAIYLDPGAVAITGGSGTREDPYTISLR